MHCRLEEVEALVQSRTTWCTYYRGRPTVAAGKANVHVGKSYLRSRNPFASRTQSSPRDVRVYTHFLRSEYICLVAYERVHYWPAFQVPICNARPRIFDIFFSIKTYECTYDH